MLKNKLLLKYWNRWNYRLLWLGFILSNILSLILIYRSSPFLISFGVIRRVFVGVSSVAIPMVYVVFLIMIVLSAKQKKIFTKFNIRVLFILMVFIAIAVISSLFYFNFQDLIKYQNYVFSTYYIYLPSLKFYAYFQILIFCVGFVSYWIANFNNLNTFAIKIPSKTANIGQSGRRWKNVLTVNNLFFLIIISILPLLLFNLVSDLPFQLKDELFVYHSYILSKDKNQSLDFPFLKKELDFIFANTPAGSTIIHPTQSNEYPLLGNEPLIRHDLFPRTLVSAKFASEYIKNSKNPDIYYILSTYVDAKTKIKTTFPNYKVDAIGITVLFLDGHVEKFVNKIYSPEFADSLKNYDVGLIKLK